MRSLQCSPDCVREKWEGEGKDDKERVRNEGGKEWKGKGEGWELGSLAPRVHCSKSRATKITDK